MTLIWEPGQVQKLVRLGWAQVGAQLLVLVCVLSPSPPLLVLLVLMKVLKRVLKRELACESELKRWLMRLPERLWERVLDGPHGPEQIPLVLVWTLAQDQMMIEDILQHPLQKAITVLPRQVDCIIIIWSNIF